MIAHPSSRALLAFEDRTLSPRRQTRIASHLRDCDRCRVRLGRRRDVRTLAREATEMTAPDVLPAVHARIGRGDVVLLPRPGSGDIERSKVRSVTSRSAVAAAVLVALTAVGAAAAGVWGGLPWGGAARAGADAPPPFASGIDVVVPATGLRVDVTEADPALEIRVRVGRDSLLVVQAGDDARHARFRTGPGQVSVSGAGPGYLALDIPPAAARVRLLIGGVEVLEATAGGLHRVGRGPVDGLRATVRELVGPVGSGGGA